MPGFSVRAVASLVFAAVGLAACLSSDAPNLATEDLTEPVGFAGTYLATAFPADPADGPDTMDATVEAIGARTYRLTLAEGEHKDDPVLLRLLTLNDGTRLGVFTDPDPAKGALYTIVSPVSNGGWVFRNVDFKANSRDRVLREALMRHGAVTVDFSTGDVQHDQIRGPLSAANLRALFSDPDFVAALDTAGGFRLSPTTPRASGVALQ